MMKRLLIVVVLALLPSLSTDAAADSFGSGDNTFEIEFVTIGDPGNAPDTAGAPNPAGSVDYVYRIGKFEVSRDMLEKANVEGGLAIRLDSMDYVTGGPRLDMPATDVSWNEAARFTNWLNTSQGFFAAYKFSAQPGEAGYDANANIELWVDGDPGFDAANPFRNSQSKYFLPSVHEWYKAAFYDPNANDGAGAYWIYPTGSDMLPTPVASGTEPGSAVWDQDVAQGPADITLAGGLSSYGVMALAGNVLEWEETEWDLVNDVGSSVRAVRGGFWSLPNELLGFLSVTGRHNFPGDPSLKVGNVGFRVASIPEPSSQLLGLWGMLGLLMWRRRAC